MRESSNRDTQVELEETFLGEPKGDPGSGKHKENKESLLFASGTPEILQRHKQYLLDAVDNGKFEDVRALLSGVAEKCE